MPYFVENNPLRRSLLVLAVIVAAGAVYLGVASYRGREQERTPAADIRTPSPIDSNHPETPKKDSAKAKRTRVSGMHREVHAADFSAGSIEALSLRERVPTDAADTTAQSDAINGVGVEPPNPDDRKHTFSPSCVPLPNATKPEDVDADYYQKWAREYGCKLDERRK